MKKITFILTFLISALFIMSCSIDNGHVPENPNPEQIEAVDKTPLCFTSAEDGSTIGLNSGIWLNKKKSDLPEVFYSTDGENWQRYEFKEGFGVGYKGAEYTLDKGQSIYFINKKTTFSFDKYTNLKFVMTGAFDSSGSVMSLLGYDTERDSRAIQTESSMPAGSFISLFENCESLKTAPSLPATKLSNNCYTNMFAGCTSLTEGPELPAEVLCNGCYTNMFAGCTNLNYIKVGFTSFDEKSTAGMFDNTSRKGVIQGPSGLETEGLLPSMWSCVENEDEYKEYLMKNFILTFTAKNAGTKISLNEEGINANGVKLLVSTDTDCKVWTTYETGREITLGAGDALYIKSDGVNAAFSTSESNYYYFTCSDEVDVKGNIMSLLDASGAAASLPDFCFYSLFKNCTNLVGLDLDMPCTNLGKSCYENMFAGCSSIANAPELPAEVLVKDCYKSMFKGCKSLSSVPLFGAVELADGCCISMFEDCNSLKSVEVFFESCEHECTTDWLKGTSTYGVIFYNDINLDVENVECPSLWSIKPIDYKKALVFIAKADNVKISLVANAGYSQKVNLQYRINDETEWTDYVIGTEISLSDTGDRLYMHTSEKNAKFNNGTTSFYYFTIIGSTDVDGNIMALIDPEGVTKTVPAKAFAKLFYNCSSINTAPMMPGTVLGESCYQYMFQKCTNLTTLPELPLEEVNKTSCGYMFQGCSKIYAKNSSAEGYVFVTTLPKPVNKNGYSNMFNGAGASFTSTSVTTTVDLYTKNKVVPAF